MSFHGFTKQEYLIIEEILKQAKSVTITICADNLDLDTDKNLDIFYFNKKIYKNLISISKRTNIGFDKKIYLDKPYRYCNLELEHLEKNLYKLPYKSYDKNPENISMFLANNPYSEIENVAINIIKLIQCKGYRYSDIVVATKSIESYKNIAKVIFDKYDIPLFIDEKLNINQNIFIKYIISFLEIFASNWRQDTVLNYLKSGFIDIPKEDIYEFEKLVVKFNIRGKNFLKDWTKDTKAIKVIKEEILKPLKTFQNNLAGVKTVEGITKKLYSFLDEEQIKEKLSLKIDKLDKEKESFLVEEYIKSYNLVIDILDEMILIFPDKNISFEKYIELFKIAIKHSTIGSLPHTIDQVILADLDRSKISSPKAMFVIGINDSMFGVITNEGFLDDKDRNILKNLDEEIAKTVTDNIYQAQFNIYQALSLPQEKICFSYLSTNFDGEALRQAELVFRINKLFPKLITNSDIINRKSYITTQKASFEELLYNLNKYANGEKIDKVWFEVLYWYYNNKKWKEKLENALEGLDYSNNINLLSKESIEKIYRKRTLFISN